MTTSTTTSAPEGYTFACEREVVPLRGKKSVPIGDVTVLIVACDEHLYAVEDRCSHDGGSFAHGALSGKVLTCPRHGATFDIATGRALTMPAVAPIETYELRITDDGWIELDMEDDE